MYRVFFSRAALSTMCLGALGCSAAFAHQDRELASLRETSVRVKLDSRSFPEALAALGPMLRHGYIIDGEPRKKEARLELNCSLAQALDKITDAFDYTWSISKSGAVLLEKRFRDEHELPQLNEAEMHRVATDELAILRALPFDPSVFAQTAVLKLGRSMTDEQMAVLRSRKVLAAASLADEQQRLMLAAIFSRLVYDTHHQIRSLEGRLGNLDHGKLQLQAHDEKNPFTGEIVPRPLLVLELQSRSGDWLNAGLIEYPGFSKYEKGN